MWFNPFLAQRLADERIRDMLREAEHERLLRRATIRRRPPVLSGVEGSVVGRALLVLGLVSAIIVIWHLT